MGNSTSIKSLVLFHDACSDGFGAAFAAWLKLGDDAEYVPMQYGKDDVFKIPPWIARDVYILDFSLPRDYMDKIFSEAKRVVWLDHHKTAFEMWCGKAPDLFFTMHKEADDRKYILLDDIKSGAYLAWEYFHPGTEVPMFIKHIDDYDRWQFQIVGTKEFNKALWSYAPWSFERWKEYLNNWEGFEFRTEGNAILRAHDQNVQSVVKGAARKCSIKQIGPLDDDDDYILWQKDGLAANCPPHLTSDVGHELATQSGTFGLLWYIDKGNNCRCSLRSNGDYDVSAIAKAFGGGGHRNAAGFTTNIQILLEWIK